MDKEYMLLMIRARIKEVETKYRAYFDTDGPSKSKAGAAVNRSKCLKEMRYLHLIEYLILRCPDTLTIDGELCEAFDRLTEPRRTNCGD